jgi:hypothetical protein
MPKRATSTSFKKGNTAALGNDKTLRLSTWIEKALDKPVPSTLKGYEEGMTYREYLANEILNGAVVAPDPKTKLDYLKEIMDRTEGKPSQNINQDITSGGEKISFSLKDL